MKKLILGLLSTVILVAIVIQPAKAQSLDLTIAPHGSKLIENNYGFSLDATCTLRTDNKTKKTLKLHVLENTGTVNGKHLSKGQSTSVVVKGNDALLVHAEPGSKVNVQNLSDNPIEATCSV